MFYTGRATKVCFLLFVFSFDSASTQLHLTLSASEAGKETLQSTHSHRTDFLMVNKL